MAKTCAQCNKPITGAKQCRACYLESLKSTALTTQQPAATSTSIPSGTVVNVQQINATPIAPPSETVVTQHDHPTPPQHRSIKWGREYAQWFLWVLLGYANGYVFTGQQIIDGSPLVWIQYGVAYVCEYCVIQLVYKLIELREDGLRWYGHSGMLALCLVLSGWIQWSFYTATSDVGWSAIVAKIAYTTLVPIICAFFLARRTTAGV